MTTSPQPKGWTEVALGDVCDIGIGKTPPRATADYWGSGDPFLSIADMNQGRDLATTKETVTPHAVDTLRLRRVLPGTALMSFKLTIGRVGVARVPLFTNEAIAHLPVRDSGRLDVAYLCRALESLDLTQSTDRAAMGATLNLRKLKSIAIPLPPIEEQRQIATVLDQADQLRAKGRGATALLDTLAKSIFRNMFGDPVTNPMGWDEARLFEVISIPLRNGVSPSRSGSHEHRVLTLSAITGDRWRPEAVKTALFASPIDSSRCVSTLDLLICRGNGNRGLVGCAKAPSRGLPDVAFPDTMIAARIDPASADIAFVEQVWRSSAVRHQLSAAARTTNGTFKVNQTMLEAIKFVLPPISAQHDFALALSRQRAALARALGFEDALDSLFGSLQQRAFRGEL